MPAPKPDSGRRKSRGYTLIEMLFVLLFATSLIVMGMPALQQMMHRSRLEGAVRECAVMCQRARLEAITSGLPVVVRFDTKRRLVVSWVDENGDGTQDPTEIEIMGTGLPGTISFSAPPSVPLSIEGFKLDPDGGQVTYFTDGSIDKEGQVRFGDVRGNYLELELRPLAVGIPSIKKWNPIKGEWQEPREGKAWEWY